MGHRPDGRILECRYDPYLETIIHYPGRSPEKRQGGWYFMRFRDDKITPNEKSVVFKILKSIQDNVTKEEV
jgi:very-short-patch-repair endonuclease